jgi:hypothetical protein
MGNIASQVNGDKGILMNVGLLRGVTDPVTLKKRFPDSHSS